MQAPHGGRQSAALARTDPLCDPVGFQSRFSRRKESRQLSRTVPQLRGKGVRIMAGKITRRSALGGAATAGVLAATGIPVAESTVRAEDAPIKGRLKQSVCKWCYPDLTLD